MAAVTSSGWMLHIGGGWGDSLLLCKALWVPRKALYKCNKLLLKLKRTTTQIKLGWALFVTYTIIQSIMRSEMCSLHLTHPSVHTWSSGQPTVQRPGSSHGLPFGAGIRTHNLGLPRVPSPTLYPLGQRLPVSANLYHAIPTLFLRIASLRQAILRKKVWIVR